MMPLLPASLALVLLGAPDVLVVSVNLHGQPVPGVHLTLERQLRSGRKVVRRAVTNAAGQAAFSSPPSPAEVDLDYDSPTSFDYAIALWSPREIPVGYRVFTVDLVRSASWALRAHPRPCDPLLFLPVVSMNPLHGADASVEHHGFVESPDFEAACLAVRRISAQARSHVPGLIFQYSIVMEPCAGVQPEGFIDVQDFVHEDLVSEAHIDLGRCPEDWEAWWNQSFSTECLPQTQPEWRLTY